MRLRTVAIILALLVCAGSLWAVLTQRQQLAVLRAQQQAVSVPPASLGEDPGAAQDKTPADDKSDGTVSEELLRLRSQVTRLNARKRGLAGVAEENARLRVQLDSSLTNAPGERPLPAGFIRKSQAQFAGYSTPENSVQSFLWAMRNHDSKAVLQSLTPGTAQRLQARIQDPNQAADFFKSMDAMPGFALQNRKDQPDGSVQFDVEIAPGIPKETMILQVVNGEWRLELPF
jgi:hypothetical protein